MSYENKIDMVEADDSAIANVNQRPNGVLRKGICNWI